MIFYKKSLHFKYNNFNYINTFFHYLIMYSLWKSGFSLDIESTCGIKFEDFDKKNKIMNQSTVQDVYNWIISLNMRRSIIIANAFQEEEVDGHALLLLTREDIEEVFKQYNLGLIGLFWLAIFKLQK